MIRRGFHGRRIRRHQVKQVLQEATTHAPSTSKRSRASWCSAEPSHRRRSLPHLRGLTNPGWLSSWLAKIPPAASMPDSCKTRLTGSRYWVERMPSKKLGFWDRIFPVPCHRYMRLWYGTISFHRAEAQQHSQLPANNSSQMGHRTRPIAPAKPSEFSVEASLRRLQLTGLIPIWRIRPRDSSAFSKTTIRLLTTSVVT